MRIPGIVGVALGMVAWSPATAEIRIAVAGPISGQYAVFGEQMRAGAEQAVADINAAGGVDGEMLVLEVGDDGCDPNRAVEVAEELAEWGAVFVTGHFCSGSSIPASKVYFERSIVQISPGSTNPAFTDERPGPGIYRVCGRDDQQGEVAGEFLASEFPDAEIAFVHDKTAYGKGLADATMAAYEAAGGEPAHYEAYTAGKRDYSDLVSTLDAAGIDVVYVGGYHTEAALLARQMREAGMDTQLVSGDTLLTDEYWAIAGEAGEGTLMTFAPDPRKNPQAQPVVEALEASDRTTEGYALYAYAAVQTWVRAVETAGTTDLEPVVQALDSGTFDTVLGSLEFDSKGDVMLPGYVFYEWSNGQYDTLAR